MRRVLTITFLILISLFFLVWRYIDHSQEKLSQKDLIISPENVIQLSAGNTYFEYFKGQAHDTLPVILFIHGGGASGSKIWKDNFQDLVEAGHSVLLYDLYGRGYSERVAKVHAPELYQNQVSELLEALQIEGDLVLVTQSMGASIGILFADQHPERVQQLIMVAPVFSGLVQSSKLLKIPVVSSLLMTFYWWPRNIDKQMLELHRPEEHHWYRDSLEKFTSMEGYKEVTKSTWQNFVNQSFSSQFSTLNIPIKLVFGKYDPYIDINLISSLSDLNPNSETIVFDSSGHFPNFEETEKFNQQLELFLKEVQ